MDPKDNKYVRQAKEGEEHVKAPEYAAKRVLQGLGFEVQVIQRNSGKTADLLVDGDDPGYVVEVASRYLSQEIDQGPVEMKHS
jgi:hypothetical protein